MAATPHMQSFTRERDFTIAQPAAHITAVFGLDPRGF
jgi:hypothetical protein